MMNKEIPFLIIQISLLETVAEEGFFGMIISLERIKENTI